MGLGTSKALYNLGFWEKIPTVIQMRILGAKVRYDVSTLDIAQYMPPGSFALGPKSYG